MEHQYFSAAFFSCLIAALVTAVLWRRQRIQMRALGGVWALVIFSAAAFAALIWLAVFAVALRQADIDVGKWSHQAIQISAGLFAYFAAGRTLKRIQVRGANAQQAPSDKPIE